jgi:hypothetical protein
MRADWLIRADDRVDMTTAEGVGLRDSWDWEEREGTASWASWRPEGLRHDLGQWVVSQFHHTRPDPSTRPERERDRIGSGRKRVWGPGLGGRWRVPPARQLGRLSRRGGLPGYHNRSALPPPSVSCRRFDAGDLSYCNPDCADEMAQILVGRFRVFPLRRAGVVPPHRRRPPMHDIDLHRIASVGVVFLYGMPRTARSLLITSYLAFVC